MNVSGSQQQVGFSPDDVQRWLQMGHFEARPSLDDYREVPGEGSLVDMALGTVPHREPGPQGTDRHRDSSTWAVDRSECGVIKAVCVLRCHCVDLKGKQVCVGYGDGAVRLWDLKTGVAAQAWQHSSLPEEEMPEKDSEEVGEEAEEAEDRPENPVAVLCVDCSADSHLVMSGCADATVKVFSVSSGKLVSAFNCAATTDQDNSIESVAFCPDNSIESVAFCPVGPYIATATNSGAVEIWDLPTSTVRHRLQHPEGVSRLKWACTAPVLYTGCLDGLTRVWDALSGASKAVLSGHARHSCILDFDVTRDGTCLVSASEDGTARVFDLRFTQS
ncbi:hypothetical protein ACOMHN_007590 [Nucella lapillus]